MKNLIKFLLKLQLKRTKYAGKINGFTLLELLVAMVLGSLVIASLLTFTLTTLETDRREQAKTRSEQEMQTALTYISKDLEQAIYIYDAQGLDNNTPNGIQDQLLSVTNGTPVLVFWKREIKPKVIPAGTATAASCTTTPANCDDAYRYSLVTYYLIKDANCANSEWSCTTRISRFQVSDAVRDLNGEVVPGQEADDGFQLFDLSTAASGSLEQRMNSWRKDPQKEYDTTNNKPQPLIDYIDQSTDGYAACSTEMRPSDTTKRLWSQVPTTRTGGFYACVNTTQTTAQVFIRGNALARINSRTTPPVYNAGSVNFPSANIQVQGRGFLNTQ